MDDNNRFKEVFETVSGFRQQITALQNTLKALEKSLNKEMRQLKRELQKRPKVKRNPSGFAKPSKVSDELCEFMLRDKGTQIARTEVTQYIIQYIKEKRPTE